jgi:hypothetical protein
MTKKEEKRKKQCHYALVKVKSLILKISRFKKKEQKKVFAIS